MAFIYSEAERDMGMLCNNMKLFQAFKAPQLNFWFPISSECNVKARGLEKYKPSTSNFHLNSFKLKPAGFKEL